MRILPNAQACPERSRRICEFRKFYNFCKFPDQKNAKIMKKSGKIINIRSKKSKIFQNFQNLY